MVVDALDWCIVVAAFVLTLGTGLWVTARGTKAASASDYFVGARAMSWPFVGASMFASNIGTEHFVGQAGSAAAGGLAVGLYEWLSIFNIMLLAWVFAPLYLRLELTTVSQYVEERFDRRCRTALTLLSLLAYVTTKISATLITGVFLVQVLYGEDVNIYLVAGGLVIVTACYTVAGGLKAVMITDAVQMAIFLVGGLLGMWVALERVSVKEMRQLLPPEFFHVWRSGGEYDWSAMFLGQPITSCWYWCIDQFISQRVLSARSLEDGQSGCIMTCWLKFLPPFMLCLPGMVARALFERCRAQGNSALSDPWCSTNLNDPHQANLAYPLLVVHEFPHGLKGLIIAAMFMAMLSSLSSVYNSASTLITIDLYQAHWRPDASDKQLVACGRAAGVLMTLLTFCWFPVMSGQTGLVFLFTQSIMSHLFPTLVVVFILGITTTTVNTQGALAGVGAGFLLGMGQLVPALLSANAQNCSRSLLFKFACMNFNHFAIILSVAVALVTVLVSRQFPAPDPTQLDGKTIWHVSKSGDCEPEDLGQVPPKFTSRRVAGASPVPAVIGCTEELGDGASPASAAASTGPGQAVAGASVRQRKANLVLSVLLVAAMVMNVASWA